MAVVAAAMSASCGASGSGTTAVTEAQRVSGDRAQQEAARERAAPQPGSRPMTWMPARITSPLRPAAACHRGVGDTGADQGGRHVHRVRQSLREQNRAPGTPLRDLCQQHARLGACSVADHHRVAPVTDDRAHPGGGCGTGQQEDWTDSPARRLRAPPAAPSGRHPRRERLEGRSTRAPRPRGIWPADSRRRRAPRAQWSAPCDLPQYVTVAVTIWTHATSRERTTRQERWQVAARCRTTTLTP